MSKPESLPLRRTLKEGQEGLLFIHIQVTIVERYLFNIIECRFPIEGVSDEFEKVVGVFREVEVAGAIRQLTHIHPMKKKYIVFSHVLFLYVLTQRTHERIPPPASLLMMTPGSIRWDKTLGLRSPLCRARHHL